MQKLILAIVVTLTFPPTAVLSGRTKPRLSKLPLDAEKVNVYKAFLRDYLQEAATVNVVNRTAPLYLSSAMSKPECLKGFAPDAVANAGQVFHSLDAELKSVSGIRLVDPKRYRVADPQNAIDRGEPVGQAVRDGFAAGVLNLSEIVLNENRNLAIIKYFFYCGRLCGNGETVYYEKTTEG